MEGMEEGRVYEGEEEKVKDELYKFIEECPVMGEIMKPKIITLCGSTRFIETFAVMAWELEKQGAIVLGLHLLPTSYFKQKGDKGCADHLAEYEDYLLKQQQHHLYRLYSHQ